MLRPGVAARGATAAVCLLLTTACISTGPGARPARSPALWNPSLTRPSQPSAANGPFDVDAALLRIQQSGYTTDTDPAQLKALKGPLRAIPSHCTGTTDGHCVMVHFFYGNNYAGYDAQGVGESSILSQDGTMVTLSYPVFKPTDPMCCASGGTREFRASWDGGKVVFSPPMTGNPNEAGG
ncbi:LppP/LprE family lipoprotein [Streptomyces orinoci]|uniref:LppP/LprE family lipoprotein n=1 Tax=Streptomyces orinoci TaxID=67339 RepID=A0ABV3JZ76_STRON|nr:LppP/LprE family lipoprotein [Streptomyces orinoci]